MQFSLNIFPTPELKLYKVKLLKSFFHMCVHIYIYIYIHMGIIQKGPSLTQKEEHSWIFSYWKHRITSNRSRKINPSIQSGCVLPQWDEVLNFSNDPCVCVCIGIMVRVFANGPRDRSSISGRVIPKTRKRSSKWNLVRLVWLCRLYQFKSGLLNVLSTFMFRFVDSDGVFFFA